MDAFSKECMRFGVLTHFKHFRLELRGREELLVRIPRVNPHVVGPGDDDPVGGVADALEALRVNHGLGSSTEVSAAGGEAAEGWGYTLDPADDGYDRAPASPGQPAVTAELEDEAVYLIGSYMHYRRPYVWVRSGFSFLPAFNSPGGVREARAFDVDTPVRLRSTDSWSEHGSASAPHVHVWDVVGDIVRVSRARPPRNPFEVDLDALRAAQPLERLHATAALLHFLRELHLSDAHAELVERDYLHVLTAHYAALADVASPPSPSGLARSARASAASSGSAASLLTLSPTPLRGGPRWQQMPASPTDGLSPTTPEWLPAPPPAHRRPPRSPAPSLTQLQSLQSVPATPPPPRSPAPGSQPQSVPPTPPPPPSCGR